MTINVTITSETLCDLLHGAFTYDACEAICNYFEEVGVDSPMMIGDICYSFAEIPSAWEDEYDSENLIAILKNGNVLIAQ